MKEKRRDGSFSKSFFMKSTVMLFRNFCLIFALLLVFSGFAQAQRSITGVVSEKDTGEPIPGAAVVVKGTTNGTSTDLDSKFALQVSDGDILQISFVGFAMQEVPVSGQTAINAQLEEDVALFDEVVVVGCGVQTKKLVTGATVQVKGDELTKRNTTNALQALQGQTSGVQISSTSGQPGEGIKVVVRGQGTISNSGPLYIVDGVQTGDIFYLNNADIESIDVFRTNRNYNPEMT